MKQCLLPCSKLQSGHFKWQICVWLKLEKSLIVQLLLLRNSLEGFLSLYSKHSEWEELSGAQVTEIFK